ncbi:MAG: 3,4-dihydroxy-2-butanone-4-phosphate synthase [Pseudomonadota bacterium]|nr:3,4-dihydroxy-2-butanone-4-phosphate synthase [Pseudomonadota bacterium]
MPQHKESTDNIASMIASAEEIIDEARAGRMFILVDDEDRENEGDLIIPAEFANADMINFMAREGRGLICLALEASRCDQLNLPMMVSRNTSRHETAFTVSIEAREGVTTGISAADRAKSISVAVDDHTQPHDIATPGHIFPLRANDGGVLVRAGHTEAAVDISRLAGLKGAGVICEIMRDDGEMARLPDLLHYAQKHKMKIGTIADLIAYRRRTEKLVERVEERAITSQYGGAFTMRVYRSLNDHVEHVALIYGDTLDNLGAPVNVRMHSVDVLGDIFGAGDSILQRSMDYIAKEGQGVVVLLRQHEAQPLTGKADNQATGQGAQRKTLRNIGLGAQILIDIGVKDMVLLSNSKPHIVGVDGYGLSISRIQNV